MCEFICVCTYTPECIHLSVYAHTCMRLQRLTLDVFNNCLHLTCCSWVPYWTWSSLVKLPMESERPSYLLIALESQVHTEPGFLPGYYRAPSEVSGPHGCITSALSTKLLFPLVLLFISMSLGHQVYPSHIWGMRDLVSTVARRWDDRSEPSCGTDSARFGKLLRLHQVILELFLPFPRETTVWLKWTRRYVYPI